VLLQAGGAGALLVVLLYLVGPWLRRLWRQRAGTEANAAMPPSFLALLLVVLLACALVTNHLGIFSIFGAFLLGVSLHQEITLVRAWREKVADLVLVALVPVFFTHTGLRTEIGSLSSATAWLGCVMVLVAAVAGKLGGCYVGARLTGQPPREAGCIAALMNTRALMGLVAINVGADLGLLPREIFTMFVIMALATTALTGPLLRWWLPDELRQRVPGLRPAPPPLVSPPATPRPLPAE
jgi:Kef-type K+ transport system membrane component KefB